MKVTIDIPKGKQLSPSALMKLVKDAKMDNIYNNVAYNGSEKFEKRRIRHIRAKKTPEEKDYDDYSQKAKARNKSFELTLDEFISFRKGRVCSYCGLPSKGIDRVENSIGYVYSNCVPCCAKCNQMKFTDSTEDFLAHIKRIYSYSH